MACTRPLRGYIGAKGKVIFGHSDKHEPLELPCGKCIDCRLDYSRHWAMRLMHEKHEHEQAIFLTLTYNEENLPPDGSLVKAHHQKFIRKLRKQFKGADIRYFCCGEYGDETQRPHYHLALYGVPLDNEKRREEGKGKGGHPIWSHPSIDRAWTYQGRAYYGDLDHDSAQYIAGYITKKLSGPLAQEKYKGKKIDHIDSETGEITEKFEYELQPPYSACSNRPAIGKRFFKRYGKEIKQRGTIHYKNSHMGIPRAYKRWWQQEAETGAGIPDLVEMEHIDDLYEQKKVDAQLKENNNYARRYAREKRLKKQQKLREANV